MNIEEFKISCRSVYPECVFVHHEIMGVVAYAGVNANYHGVAAINDGTAISDACKGSVFVAYENQKTDVPCFDYRLVAEKSFVNELLAARK